MGDFSFTRVSKNGAKSSKLDRFSVSCDVFLSNSSSLALDLNIVDHMPIFLVQDKPDYGLYPFKFFNSWMLEDDFDQAVRSFWSSDSNNVGYCAPIIFKEKLKGLEVILRE